MYGEITMGYEEQSEIRKSVDMWLAIISAPIVLLGAWMLGYHGTILPCDALDQILIERITADKPPETTADYLAIQSVPVVRYSYAPTTGKCLEAVLKSDWKDISRKIGIVY